MEERDDGALELSARCGLDRGGGEGAPDDGLADVRGDEEGDAGAETIALGEHLVPDNDEKTGNDELRNQEEAVGDADGAVHAGVDIDEALDDSDNNTDN